MTLHSDMLEVLTKHGIGLDGGTSVTVDPVTTTVTKAPSKGAPKPPGMIRPEDFAVTNMRGEDMVSMPRGETPGAAGRVTIQVDLDAILRPFRDLAEEFAECSDTGASEWHTGYAAAMRIAASHLNDAIGRARGNSR